MLNLGHRAVVAAAGVKGKSAFFGSLQGLLMAPHHHQQQGNSQGSAESEGGCSSGVSELESKTTNQGSGSTHPTQERGSQDPPLGLNKQPKSSDNNMKEVAAVGGIEYMPCVFTIGDGPNGRKVESILYKYCRGEEVRIMYVCHDSFFSPVEFVKHPGRHDVEHPLKHIFVNPPRPSNNDLRFLCQD